MEDTLLTRTNTNSSEEMNDMNDLGFLTVRGEERATSALFGLIRDIESDRLTRKAALRLLADVLEEVSGIDGESIGEESVQSIISVLNPSFSKAGFIPTNPSEVAEFRLKIRQDVARIAFADLPEGQTRVGVACQGIAVVLDRLENKGWKIGRHGEDAHQGISLTMASPEESPWTNRTQIWGFLVGTKHSAWVDMFGAMATASPVQAKDQLMKLFPEREDFASDDLVEIQALSDAMLRLNEAIVLCDAEMQIELDDRARPMLSLDGLEVNIETVESLEGPSFSPHRF